VTGGSGGIGRVAAEHLARDGFSVAIAHGGNKNRAEEVVESIACAGRDGAAFQVDISSEADVAG
jgi:3-oxoacyl-[acyl-carrier protein] reductase